MAGEDQLNYDDIAGEDDPFKLAALVESGGSLDVDPGEEKPNVEAYRGHQFQPPEGDKDTKPADAGASKGSGGEKPQGADAGASKGSGDDKPAGDETQAKDKGGTSVKTADGQGDIPYAVLKNTREQNAQLKAEVDRLSQELETVKNGGSASDDAPEDMTPEQRQEHIKQLEAEIQSVEDDYDPELAKPMRRLLQESLNLARRVDAVDEAVRNQPTEEDREEGQAIMQAIDKSPVMAEWYSRGDDTWYQRATQVHQAAIQTDEAYQSMSHDQRMQELPKRVQAVFGADPDLQASPAAETKGDTKAGDGKPADSDKSTKQSKEGDDKDIVPHSMDDLPPGGTPDTSGKFGPVGEMSGANMTDYFGRLADQGKLEQVLANFSG